MFKLLIKTKFIFLIVLLLSGLCIFGYFSFKTINKFKINGTLSSKYNNFYNLSSDFHAAPLFISESYMIALEMINAKSEIELNDLIDNYQFLKKDFYDNYNCKYKNFKSDKNLQSLIKGAFDPADKLFKTIDNEFIPALKNKDKLKAQKLLDDDIRPLYSEHKNAIDKIIDYISSQKKINDSQVNKELKHSLGFIKNLFLIIVFTIFLISFLILMSIYLPLNILKKSVEKMAYGKTIKNINVNTADEIGIISKSLNTIIDDLHNKVSFSDNIGKGNFNSEYIPLSKEDDLGNSLLKMRANLQKTNEKETLRRIDDEHRNKTTSGLAEIGNLLRSTENDTDKLYNDVISFIVKYLDANQGGLYVINDDDENDTYVELKSFYAFTKEKFEKTRIEFKEGLIGACIQEKSSIYLNEIPENYTKISSGLGKAEPIYILIVPLKINDIIQGAIELATFNPLQNWEIELAEKFAESIASTITNIKVNEKTKILLIQSQKQTEAIRLQEAELRENMEELRATQEESQRTAVEMERLQIEAKENEIILQQHEEIQKQKDEINEKARQLEASNKELEKLSIVARETDNAIMIYDNNFKLEWVNAAFIKLLGYTLDEYIELYGADIRDVSEKKDVKEVIEECLSTKKSVQYHLEKFTKDKHIIYVQTTLSPLLDDIGNINKIIAVDTDITVLKTTQEKLAESEKMADLGQLIAGVAHEINTPLGAIRSSVNNISQTLTVLLGNLPDFFKGLSTEQKDFFIFMMEKSLGKDMNITTKEERKFRREINSVLEDANIPNADSLADTLVDMGIYDATEYIENLKESNSLDILNTAYKLSGMQRSSQTITTAADRANKIVFALKSFAHFDTSGQMTNAFIHDGIEIVLTLYHNLLKQGVEVIRNYSEVPQILCFPDELNQVWTNLIHNAIQAMENKGTLTIGVVESTMPSTPLPCIKVSFTDSGKGIPPEIQDKIFKPFFTTKKAGEGSGLGLDIVMRIIEKHKGIINFESEPGKTTFFVYLPFNVENG